MLDYCLFLAGPPLLRRALFLEQKDSPGKVSRDGDFAQAQSQGLGEDLVLRYSTRGAQTTEQALAATVSLGAYFCKTLGIADGGLDVQPLVHATSVLGNNVIWCGDGDSIRRGSKEILEAQSFAFASEQWPLMKIPSPKFITRLDFQTSKAFSDSAALFEHIIGDCAEFFVKTLFQREPWQEKQQEKVGKLGKSLCSGVAPQIVVVEIVGALGGRRDHELANLKEIRSLFFGRALRRVLHGALAKVLGVSVASQKQQAFLELVARFQKLLRFTCIVQPSIILTHGPVKIMGLPQGLPLGIFGPDDCLTETVTSLEGLMFHGKVVLSRPSHGLSNEVAAECVKVSVLPVTKRGARGANQKPGGAKLSPYVEIVLGHNEREWIQS